jgi:alginate O-acetyltransferase complex protein AlgI
LSFISYPFLLLFLVTLLARFTFGRRKNEKSYLVFLLAASLVFYASYRASYLFLLLGITLVDFVAGQKISGSTDPARKKAWLLVSLVSNLGLLAFYKYSDFFLETFREILRVSETNLLTANTRLNLELPLGISFFTFQNMSYTIDIYRGQLRPEKRYWRFLLFVSFFTHLVSGPIVRARELIYQFDRQRWPHLTVFLQGVYLMVRGFF